jgi:hypothetical protein
MHAILVMAALSFTLPMSFTLPAGVAAHRLNEFSTQSGLQVLYSFEDLMGVITHPVEGEMPPFDALDKMIDGTPISYEFVNHTTVTLRVRASEGRTPWVYQENGMYYGCVPLKLMDGMVLSKAQHLSLQIAIGLDLVPDGQLYCTPAGVITPEDEWWEALAEGGTITVEAKHRKAPIIRWKQ